MLKSVATGSIQVADALRLTPYFWRKNRFLKFGGDENLRKYVATALLRFEKGHFKREKLLVDIEKTIERFPTGRIGSHYPSGNARNEARLLVARKAAQHGFTEQAVRLPLGKKLVLQSLLNLEPLEKSLGINYVKISHLRLLATAAFERGHVDVGLQACSKAIRHIIGHYHAKFDFPDKVETEINKFLELGVDGAMKADSKRAAYDFLCQHAIWALNILSQNKYDKFASVLVLKASELSTEKVGIAFLNPYEEEAIRSKEGDFKAIKEKVEERSSPL